MIYADVDPARPGLAADRQPLPVPAQPGNAPADGTPTGSPGWRPALPGPGISDLSRRRAAGAARRSSSRPRAAPSADITVGDCLEFMETQRHSAPGDPDERQGQQLLPAAAHDGPAPAGRARDAAHAEPPVPGTAHHRRAHRPATTWPAARSATCWSTTWTSGSRHSTTRRCTARPFTSAGCSGRTSRRTIPASARCDLAPDVAIAWKQRLSVKTVSSRDAAGSVTVTSVGAAQHGLGPDRRPGVLPRHRPVGGRGPGPLGAVGGALPVRRRRHPARKGRRPPQVPDGPADPGTPPGAARPGRRRRPGPDGRRRRLAAAAAAAPGEDCSPPPGSTLRRTVLDLGTSPAAGSGPRTRSPAPAATSPARRTRRSGPGPRSRSCAHTGIRIEELTELSHHSLVQYRLPATGELVPLLHIAPSKTDSERLLVISPELADVLAAIIARVRNSAGTVPLVVAYDSTSATWTPPMPLLFQHRVGADNRPSRLRVDPQLDHQRAGKAPASPTPPASRCASRPTTSGGSSPPTRS